MEHRSGTAHFLSPYKVLDLTEDKGEEEKGHSFCAQILGDLGAQVTRLEKPGVQKDFWWWAYNSRKTLVYLDIEKEGDRLPRMVREADILIESFPPGYLDSLGLGYAALKKINPELIMTSLTHFGQTGPYRDFKASDLEVMALSGVLHGMGDPDRPPVRISLPQSFLITSIEAAAGTIIALCQREITGEGQQVDVSAQESVHCMLENKIRRQVVTGSKTRLGGYHPPMERMKPPGGPGTYHHSRHPQIWKCKDGHIAFLLHPGMIAPETNRTLAKYMEREGDLPELVKNIHWETFDWVETSPEDAKIIWDTFARFFARHTYRELYQIALKERAQLFPGYIVKDLLMDEQLAARQFWQEQAMPDLTKTLKMPGSLAKVTFPANAAETLPRNKAPNPAGLPFAGVKVLDFTWVVVGPWMTQWLPLYGAELIKVESARAGPQGRSSREHDQGFVAWNTSKKSLRLNLKTPRGKELIRQLVAWADVVTENFSPGTMRRMGLSYEELLKINPRLIMFSTSMLGADGPHAAQPGLGQILSTLSGFTDLTGWPDRLPVTAHGPYTDVISCRVGAAVLFAALNYQRRTGKGCYIDISQFETSLHFLTPLILEYQAKGNLLQRMGNRSLTDAPHGVFPCQGEDRWCTVSVSDDAEWQALCKVIGRSEWTQDPRFNTLEHRKQNEDELEKLIAEWTVRHPSQEVMHLLQEAGVKAGAVEGPDEILRDSQLEHRHHFVVTKHAELGEYDFLDSGFRLEKARPVINSAPLFGEHTHYVATRILGLAEEEFEACLKSGVFD